MKETRFTKIAALLLATVLMLGVVFSFGVSAITSEEITETAKISSLNVEHRDLMHLAFKVEINATYTPTGTVGIMIWNNGTTDYTAGNSIYSSYELKDDSAGTKYYAGQGISAVDIDTSYCVAVVEKALDGAVTLLSKPVTCSVADWANTKLAEADISPAERRLYNNVLAYGRAAEAVLGK